MERLRGFDIFCIFKANVFSIDKEMDFGRVTFGVQAIVELCKLDRSNLRMQSRAGVSEPHSK